VLVAYSLRRTLVHSVQYAASTRVFLFDNGNVILLSFKQVFNYYETNSYFCASLVADTFLSIKRQLLCLPLQLLIAAK
jgi:hypothetical protein